MVFSCPAAAKQARKRGQQPGTPPQSGMAHKRGARHAPTGCAPRANGACAPFPKGSTAQSEKKTVTLPAAVGKHTASSAEGPPARQERGQRKPALPRQFQRLSRATRNARISLRPATMSVTARSTSTMPNTMRGVSRSPNTNTPKNRAVMGSSAPRMAALVEPM